MDGWTKLKYELYDKAGVLEESKKERVKELDVLPKKLKRKLIREELDGVKESEDILIKDIGDKGLVIKVKTGEK